MLLWVIINLSSVDANDMKMKRRNKEKLLCVQLLATRWGKNYVVKIGRSLQNVIFSPVCDEWQKVERAAIQDSILKFVMRGA